LQDIRKRFPGEKVIIFSNLLQYQDLLAEAFRRKPQYATMMPLRYDGTVNDESRQFVQTNFANRNDQSPPLITHGVGGASVNLDAASHVILSEPLWVRNNERQAPFWAYRQEQISKVHVWQLRACNSLTDVVVDTAASKKATVSNAFVDRIQRPDETLPKIPPQFLGRVGE
jgi:SNF2 family DNA or RNA helicase